VFHWEAQKGAMAMASPTFIRIFNKAMDREILININAISEIHVEYVLKVQSEQGKEIVPVNLKEGRNNPEAMRMYHVFVGEKKYSLPANPGSPVLQTLEEFYKKAIKWDK
jgi:hypothetical protein